MTQNRTPKPDITVPEDVEIFVRAFYDKVYEDKILSPMFKVHAGVKMEDHLPKMFRFWKAVTLGISEYDGNAFEVHQRLNRKSPLQAHHFERWLELFRETLDFHFEGPNVGKAVRCAEGIAHSFQGRLKMLSMSQMGRAAKNEEPSP